MKQIKIIALFLLALLGYMFTITFILALLDVLLFPGALEYTTNWFLAGYVAWPFTNKADKYLQEKFKDE